ncbi:MAG TPA: methyltransferase regulatory domain-containing protein [Opitutaceae bacterium]
MRGMLRDMMLYHSRKFDDPQQQIAQARALIDWLDETVRAADSPYAVLLRSELEQMHGWRDSYFRHDSLEEVNVFVYFHEFMERAERHGLQYLAEAEFHTMLASNYAPPVSETLNRLGRDIIELEQYMDFVRNRMFRQTLLCHRGVKLKRALGPWTLHDLRVAAGFRPKTGNLDIASHEAGEFSDSGRATISSNQPIVKAAFLLLGQHWPKSIPFRELVGLARSHLEAAGPNSPAIPAGRAAEEAVAGAILTCLSKGACELHVHAGAFVTTISERPLACPYSRWQARSGPVVTNRRHERVELDNFGRQLLLLLDGEKDPDALVDSLTQLAVAGTLIVLVDEKVTHDREIIRAIMPAQAEAKLLQLGRLALLVG